MNHQPFESWMFTDDALDQDQQRELDAHLQTCEHCSSLAMARDSFEQIMDQVPMIEPVSGFQGRWRMRLQEHRLRMHRRQTSWILFLLSFGAIVFLFPLLVQGLIMLFSPNEVLIDFAQEVFKVVKWWRFLGEYAYMFTNNLISTVPLAWWLILFVSVLVLSLGGLGVIYKFSLQWRKKGVSQ